jgi:hypothetical protein
MPGRGAIPKFEAEARPKRRRVLALATHEDGAAILAPLHLRHSAEGDTARPPWTQARRRSRSWRTGRSNSRPRSTMWTARLSSPLISTKEQSGSQAPRRTVLQWVDEREQDQAERRRDTTRKHHRRGHLCRPERLLRQLPLDAIPGRLDPRPARLVPKLEGRANARPFQHQRLSSGAARSA